ncbi:MAG: hypothetical protein KKE02_20865 [Alphaproteobacteria bacterium]|nr:hypothetical protein [Alphaproteobacteria bacterium]MBU1514513.1 hypothetical protein [Alphaproteobacteria bacterium]MBU2096855.1 hypothetical protein [Alphaproteobacteria bacterium]MBU2153482.1 hypothetical protein [Alphaproteobacteria bacterium]MBU2306013.1 hypothetical protein [Alphaproteobacteria bacterium]
MSASDETLSGATPLKPIGGFIGLASADAPPGRTADFGGQHVLQFWNARAALAHLLASLGVGRIWMPSYICGEPALAAAEAGCQVLFYPVGAGLIPDGDVLARGLRAGDAVLGVDYFGAPSPVLPDLAQRIPDMTWIQDRAQAPWPDPAPWGAHILYSPRKVVGAADGGVLVSRDGPVPPPQWAPDPDQSRLEPARLRAEDPLGVHGDIWFPAYRAAEAAMSCAPRPMSNLSRSVIDALDLNAIAARRRRNAGILLSRVGSAALFQPDRLLAGAPLGVPVLTDDAGAVVARMARDRVFCARHWADLPSPAADFPAEHALSRRLLTLPCDHRYDDDDMVRVAETFLARR